MSEERVAMNQKERDRLQWMNGSEVDGMTKEELQARVEKLQKEVETAILEFEVETHEKVSLILLRRYGDVAKVHVQLSPR